MDLCAEAASLTCGRSVNTVFVQPEKIDPFVDLYFFFPGFAGFVSW